MKPLTTGSYNNITKFDNCYGCGVCAVVCHAKIINIRLNEDGFYKPYIDNISGCTNCGLCLEVCAFNHQELAHETEPIACYAAWSKDPAIRYKCSSGGVGFEVGRALINKGYKVCGVRYAPESQRAEHYIASSWTELIPSIGSKYIQSYTVDGFKAIDRKCKYLVTGTPCQIDSFRRYINKFRCEENFVLMDFFCHGVPSMLMWEKYIYDIEKITGKITYASWRNKGSGWQDSQVISIDGETTENKNENNQSLMAERICLYKSRLSQGDLFFLFFLNNFCLNKTCYDNCKYHHKSSSADIRIGDMWGKTYANNNKGVSAAIAYTQKGLNILNCSNCNMTEYPFDIVAEAQLRKSVSRPIYYSIIRKRLRKYESLSDLYHSINLLYLCFTKVPRMLVYYTKRIIQKLGLLK